MSVTFEKELRNVEAYLALEKLNYGDRLKIEKVTLSTTYSDYDEEGNPTSTSFTYTATPASGYKFVEWRIGTTSYGSAVDYESNSLVQNLVAVFAALPAPTVQITLASGLTFTGEAQNLVSSVNNEDGVAVTLPGKTSPDYFYIKRRWH